MNLRTLLLTFLLACCSGRYSHAQKISFVYNLSNAVGPNYQLMESVEMGGKLYFSTWADSGTTLWVVDGGNVSQVYHWSYNPGDYALNKLYVYGNRLLFTGVDSANGKELWSSDGTTLGTRIVIDLKPGHASSFPEINSFTYNLNNRLFTPFVFLKGKVYFSASGGIGNGSSVFESDGTPTGTRDLDVFPHLGSPYGTDAALGTVNGKLFTNFYGANNNYGLYSIDSHFTTNTMFSSMNIAHEFFYWGNHLMYKINHRNGLAFTDGNSIGPVLVDSFRTLTSDLSSTSTELFFFSQNNELCKIDSSMNGITVIKNGFGGTLGRPSRLVLDQKSSSLTSLNSKLYFTGGRALWISDGTAVGTVKVKEYPSDTSMTWIPTYPTCLTSLNGNLFFRGFDSTRVELFLSDGTEAGTTKVQYDEADFVDSTFFIYLYPAPGRYQPYFDIMMTHGNSLFFTAKYKSGVGKALYRLDFTNGIVETKTENRADLVAFPNPGNGRNVSLLYPNGYDLTFVSDATGRVVFKQPIENSGKSTIQLQHLASGTYFIQVTGKGGRLTTPFVLQR